MAKRNSDVVVGILKPGSNIRAEVSLETVKALAERLYGITCLEVSELSGFDDRNFFISEDPNMKNPIILDHSHSGYVLKIMNSNDSQHLSFVEAQCELLNYLSHHAIKCPRPFRNVFGHLYSVEKLGGKSHAVRLLNFIPGETLRKAPKSEFLLYQVGEYLANFDRLLKGFNHSGLIGRSHIWMLEQLPQLENFKSAVKDADVLSVIDEVMKQFQEVVIPRIPELEKGLIHGDANEDNIVAALNTTSGKQNDWRIAAILDMGDVSVSPYLFELAIAMTYMMRITGDINSGGFVLAGYTINRILPQEEYSLLKISIAARCVQALVMCTYGHVNDPNNKYIETCVDVSKQLLLQIWKEDDEDIVARWKKVAENYLTRSKK